jgi:hypothetical protein
MRTLQDLDLTLRRLLYLAIEAGVTNARRRWGDTAAITRFKKAYQQVLFRSAIERGTEEQELTKAIYMDLIRWFIPYRYSYSRSMLRGIRQTVASTLELFVQPSLNPYCNYSMAFGLTCDTCPLVANGIVTLPRMPFSVAERFYMRCYISDAQTVAIVKLCDYLTADHYSSFGNDTQILWDQLKGWAKEEVILGRGIQLYERVFGEVIPRRKRRLLEAAVEVP